MTERALWHTMRKHLAPHGVLQRIEERGSAGVSDVHYMIRGKGGWVELKYLPNWPKRRETPVRAPHFTLDQLLFIQNYTKAGGRAFMLLQVADEYILLNSVGATKLWGAKFDTNSFGTNSFGGSFPDDGILLHGIGGTFPAAAILAHLTERH